MLIHRRKQLRQCGGASEANAPTAAGESPPIVRGRTQRIRGSTIRLFRVSNSVIDSILMPVNDEPFLIFPADLYVFWYYGKQVLSPLRVNQLLKYSRPSWLRIYVLLPRVYQRRKDIHICFSRFTSLLLLYICKHTMSIRGDSESLCQSAFVDKGEYVLRPSFD